jgi:hypothetical protein
VRLSKRAAMSNAKQHPHVPVTGWMRARAGGRQDSADSTRCRLARRSYWAQLLDAERWSQHCQVHFRGPLRRYGSRHTRRDGEQRINAATTEGDYPPSERRRPTSEVRF